MNRAMVIVKAGDPDIADAVERGIREGRARRLTHEQAEVVSAEIDRQHIVRKLVRVAVGNTKTNDDYDAMITKARGDYGERRWGGALRRIGTVLLVVYAMAVYALAMAYRAQDIVLGRR